ncbi:hypothetical protein ASJ81_17600 [Methanosarcina spelaei]|uniref:Uncharacterized protein n=1 Tax=Methanosarcina spelaei TaxID=1036679 RepID=A0A2A2HW60_9EURY|nr:hypothetical protein [Methanosarcina spelaei]PAV13490.1 hypothetical protein ASJ81_17600 [Methanosarcina spelaei]
MLPSEMKTFYDEIEMITQYITKIKADLDKANYELIKTKAKIMKYNIIELANQYQKNCKNLDEIINS